MIFRRRPRPITPFSRDPKVHLDIDGVTASRAMFGDGMANQRVMVSFRTTDQQIVEFEMTIDTAHTLLEQVTASYHAIVPKLRTNRSFN